ncbi:MAG: hypothetical protein KDE59_12930, partial [Anaerolineales bacterium]|nr:hypothetical protein [Anaerolineales bacterium]
VYAAEVEAVFLTHPQVAECALIGKPDEKWGEIGLMLVVPAGPEPDADALLTHCGERLARYKIPKEIQFVDSLPYSPYGKVEKVKLRVQYL